MSIQQMFFCLTSVYYSPYMDQAGNLFDFTSFTFTNGGATGRNGPTSFSGNATYTSQTWYSTYFTVSAGIQYWYAPVTGNYTIRAAGAAGHNGYYSNRCRGIIIESIVTLEKGMLYKIMIGQKGSVYSNGSGGGGGGTFLTEYFNVPIIISGGGAGSYLSNPSYSSYSNSDGQSGTSGANSVCATGLGGSNGDGGTGSSNGYGGGGGGLYGNGTAAPNAAGFGYSGLGFSFINGGTGGNTATDAFGGFGGGGGTHGNTGGGGGGGGYSGGGGSNQSFAQNVGGGGGSYSQTAITEIGYNTGHGYLTITKSSYTYRYIRWFITDIKTFSAATSVQVSDFVLRNDSVDISMSAATVTNPGGSNPGSEGPSNLKDGNTSTKWLDFNIKNSPFTSTVIFDMGSQVTFNEYYWATANDLEERDPKSWTISGSNDGTNYTTLHTVTGFTATSARQINQTVQSF